VSGAGTGGAEGVERALALLRRGAVHLVEEAELRERLASGRPLRVKVGFDPTAPDLHLGHTVVLHKMRQFQDLGHEIVFLIGDFTGMVGDPTGKSRTRPVLSADDVAKNAETYKRQVFKVLDAERTRVEFNSKWLGALSSVEMMRLAARVTVARTLEREDFDKRIRAGDPIALHEMLYPLMQAFDSVALRADVEMGGTDQLFNLLLGRDLMRSHGLPPQVVITLPLLEGLEGAEKMSKSLGNHVGIDEPPREMFGKLMSISDERMWRYYELLSAVGPDELAALRAGHPKEAKVRLAMEMVARFHSGDAATEARGEFDRMFGAGRGLPDEIPERAVACRDGGIALGPLLRECGLVSSNMEAGRLVAQGGVEIDGRRATDPRERLPAGGVHLLRVGKRRVCRVKLE
jgi:tyrosyl-tRNA synthetase